MLEWCDGVSRDDSVDALTGMGLGFIATKPDLSLSVFVVSWVELEEWTLELSGLTITGDGEVNAVGLNVVFGEILEVDWLNGITFSCKFIVSWGSFNIGGTASPAVVCFDQLFLIELRSCRAFSFAEIGWAVIVNFDKIFVDKFGVLFSFYTPNKQRRKTIVMCSSKKIEHRN